MAVSLFILNQKAASRPPNAGDHVFETVYGYITTGAVSDKEWLGMCRALGHPEWLDDPRFNTPAGRVRYADARLELTAGPLKSMTTAEALQRLEAEQVPCAHIHSREEMMADPQVAANGLIVDSVHPHAWPMRQPRPAARFEATPAEIRTPAPGLGEHTDAVLAETGLRANAPY